MEELFCVKKMNNYSDDRCLIFHDNFDNDTKKKIYIRKCRMHGGELSSKKKNIYVMILLLYRMRII